MSDEKQTLCLYVTNNTEKHTRLMAELGAVLDQYYPGHYQFEMIDVLKEMDRAIAADVYATPTLVKDLPAPARQVLVNLAETRKTLVLIGLIEEEE